MTYRWKPFLRFKRELQSANVTVRRWSRDILRFAVCGLQFPMKNLMLKVSSVRITSQKQSKNSKIGQIITAFWTIFARLNISSYPEFAGEQATEHGKLTSI